jgi:acetolactate synthase small subunit
MNNYGIAEVVRTGLAAIERGSKQIKNQKVNEEE